MIQKADRDDKLIVGRFGAPFGVKGWIKVNSFTDPISNILEYDPWYLHTRSGYKAVTLEDGHIHGKTIVVKLPQCNDRDIAKTFTHVTIAIDRNQLPELKAGEFYWDDLIGLEVFNQDNVNFGIVKELLATGANDVLVVTGDRERLIPYIKQVILQVDLKNKKIVVNWDKDF
jgi:16S rRNA processing protein RimM